jgi:hypothetical protein
MFKGKWLLAWLIVVLAVLLITHAAAMAKGPETAVREIGSDSAAESEGATTAGDAFRVPIWPTASPSHNRSLPISGGGSGVNLAE